MIHLDTLIELQPWSYKTERNSSKLMIAITFNRFLTFYGGGFGRFR